MATGGPNFLSLNNSRRQRGLHSTHHHPHAFHHHNATVNPFQNQFLNPLARAYHHLTATLPNATQPHHFHHNNAFHNAKTTDLHEDDSLSSVSMLSSEQTKRKVRWILSLGLLLPALAAIIGVVAWAVSAEVVMGVQREAALKNQQEFHNHVPNDLLIDQLQTRLIYNSERPKHRNVFGERINSNIKTLASTESKDNLIPTINQNNRQSTNDDLIGNALNQDAKLTTKTLPITTLKETEDKMEDVDTKDKNSVENLQLNSGKNDLKNSIADKDRLITPSNQTDLNEEKNDSNDLNEESNTNDNSDDEKPQDEKPQDEKTKGDDLSNDEKPDSINEKLEDEKSNNNEESSTNSTPLITTKITTTKIETTSSTSDGENGGKVKTTTRQMVLNQQDDQQDDQKEDRKKTIGNNKKSAGAQVAEVIDKLVAQRNGRHPPHIVVVAPYRVKNGNKKLTVTEGNVHAFPPFGSRSISAQNLAGFLSGGNKGSSRQSKEKPILNRIVTISTMKATVSTTPSTTTTEEMKSASLDETGDEMKNEKADEESKSDDNGETSENSENENEKAKANPSENSSESKGENKENNDSKSDDDDETEEDEEASTTAKPVLINRIREAVRTQSKKEKQLADRRENTKKNEKSNEKLNSNASTKHKDSEEQQQARPRTRSRKTSSRKNTGASLRINHDDAKANQSSSIDDSIRRIDDELPEKLISLDLTKDEDLFLKEGGFLKKTTSLEKAFEELEKSKNLKYQEHEYIHQMKEKETYLSSSSNNRKQTVKPLIDLQSITKPSSSPPPQPQINQHFLVNTSNQPQTMNRKHNRNAQSNFNKQFGNSNANQPQLSKFTNQDHRPLESNSFNRHRHNQANNGQKNYNNKAHARAPASYSYQMMNRQHAQEHHLADLRSVHNSNLNFAAQQSQQQKQILNHLLQANAASSNQIQRSMNVNGGVNQLNHLKMQPQRAVHIPKQQLIQHIQMLSNLNSKHTYPTAQSPQQLLNHAQQMQNQPNLIDLSQNNMNTIATPLIGPDQYAELSQMMDGKISPTALAAMANAHYQEQNARNQQQGMESGYMDSSNHMLNVQPTKPQIHYADQSALNNGGNQFTDASNINPTNLPPQNANLQAAESIGHSQHSAASSNMLSVGDPSNAAVVNFNLKEPPGGDKGLHMSFGSGPSSGGASLVTNPLGIFKSIFLPLLPKPRMNLNGKVVFGVVLDTSLRKPAPKVHAPVIVVPASKPHHHFFG